MKTKLLLTAAAAVLALSAAPALAETTGYVGAAYGNTEVEVGGFDADSDQWGLEGAVAVGEPGAVNFQFDASYVSADDIDADTFAGTAHIFTRQDGYALGGFVGYADVEGTDAWFLGVEGAKHFEQVSLVAGVGYSNVDDIDADVWGGNVEGRFFATDNFRLDARVGYFNVDTGFGDTDAWTLGAGAEYQLSAAPVSFYATFDNAQFDDVDVDVNTWMFGVRYNFGGSLKERTHSGATFKPLGGLTGFTF